MNPRLHSIASLMQVVGLVALNLAIGRVIFLFEPWRLAGIGPIAICIQSGLFFLLAPGGWGGHDNTHSGRDSKRAASSGSGPSCMHACRVLR